LDAVYERTDNEYLKKIIKPLKKQKSITMEEFVKFMKDSEYQIDGQDVKIPASYDIKEFMKSLGDELNEGRDLSEMFIDKTAIQNRVLQDVTLYSAYEKSST
jgi:hypothetical protein